MKALYAVLFVSVLALSSCATVPKLTPEDRKRDIQFMADWARDYSPFVELAAKHKGTPSYEALLPKYLEIVIGRKVRQDISFGTALQWDMLEDAGKAPAGKPSAE